jgi:hypothetical protein
LYDDDLLIKEIAPKDIINVPLEKEEESYYKIRESTQRHLKTINRSIDILKEIGVKNIYNFETHLPRIYQCKNLQWIFKTYPLAFEEIPYALATLYFNIFPYEATFKPLSEKNAIQARFSFADGAGCYDSNTIEAINEAVEGKTWVNYNDKALHSINGDGYKPLMKWIERKLPNKSNYES